MKKLLAFVLFLCVSSIAYADKIIIPGSCYPKKIQKEFKNRGIKLDLSGNDRTKESWGFLVNEGSEFTIYTYKGATEEDLNLVYDVWRTYDENNSVRTDKQNKEKN
jgi:hypothetical protein